MERYEMKKVIQFIRGMYPQWRPDGNTVDAWFEFFREFEARQVTDAVMVYARKSQFVPSAAEILKEIQSVPRFELLNFNDKMFTIKVYIKDEQLEDSVFCFYYSTKEEANEGLKRLKEHHSYAEIEHAWARREYDKAAPGSNFRKLYHQKYGGTEA